jgi:hypothetical protein
VIGGPSSTRSRQIGSAVDAGALPRKRDRSIWSRRARVRSAAANDRAFGSEADGALPGRPDGGAVDLDGTLTPAPDAMAEAKTSLRDPARSCATRHAIAEAPPARRQAADDPRRSEGSGFYKRNSAVRIGEAPSDAVPRRPATALRSQARSHDITVTSGLTGAPDPRVKRSSVTFRAVRAPVSQCWD